jgi:hypothetical protein
MKKIKLNRAEQIKLNKVIEKSQGATGKAAGVLLHFQNGKRESFTLQNGDEIEVYNYEEKKAK